MIILPALLLAGMGLFALRQDRVLARVEAEEQAKQLLSELGETAFPNLVRPMLDTLGALHANDETWKYPAAPEQEALSRLRVSWKAEGMSETACLLDGSDRLIYPAPPQLLPPTPQPLLLETLNLQQQDAWFACEEMWISGAPDWQRVRALMASGAPERLLALARFWTALALVRNGVAAAASPPNSGATGAADEQRFDLGIPSAAPGAAGASSPMLLQGIAELRNLRELSRAVLAESGIPIRDLAALQVALLADALPVSERADVARQLCARLLAEPSPMADVMWEQVSRMGPLAKPWQFLRSLHDEARQFHLELRNVGMKPGPLLFRGAECWVLEQPVQNGRWLIAAPIASLREALDGMQRGMVKPPYFGVEIRLAGKPLLAREREQPVLAQAPVVVAGMPLELAIFLTDPAAFDAKRAQRARWTMALIGTSLLAVLAGFFAAWRAFRRQQQLSEMKTNFVSSVSHELRAPIASVQLMAEELVEGARPTDEKLATYHRFIGQECRRLSAVIENVLDFARREQGRERFEFEPTDLRKLVTGTAQLFRACAAERGTRITEVCQGAVRDVTADGHALQRVLVNLVDNAIKHSPPNTEVVVGLEFDGERVMLWVEDEGPGIPRAEHERIFERFYRIGSELRRQTQGVGLGLSIVKHLVEVHGGTVSVHSAPGEGSRFVVDLPASPTARAEQPKMTSA